MYQNQNPPNQFQTPPDGILDEVLGDVDNVERTGSQRIPRLGIGNHQVAIARFYGYDSQRGAGKILTLEVIVEKSNVHSPGERRVWQFMPNSGKPERQKYEKNRVLDFMVVVDTCAGFAQPRGSKVTGAHLASGQLRGTLIDVSVFQATRKNKQTGVEEKIFNSKNEPVNNARFSAVQQTADQIRAKGASLPADPPLPQMQQYVPHPAQQPQYAPPPYQQRQQYAPQQPQYAPPAAPQYAPQPAPAPQYQQPQYAPPQQPAPPFPSPAPQQYPFAPSAPNQAAPQPQYAPYPQPQPQQGPMPSIFENLKGNS